MRLEAFQDRLHDAGLGTAGVDLFTYAMPASASEGVMLRAAQTPTPINHEMPGYFPAGGFQLVVRALDPDSGFTRVQACIAALDIRAETVGGYRVHHCRPRHLPLVSPQADSAGLEFAVTFDVNFSLD